MSSYAGNVVRLVDVSNNPGHWGPFDAMDHALDGMLASGSVQTLICTYVDADGAVHTTRAGTDAAITLLAQKLAQSELDSYSFGPTGILRPTLDPPDDAA